MQHMLDLFFSDQAAWFGIPALLGSVFFLLRSGLMLVGGGDFGHGDFDAHADLHHGDPGDAFRLLSVQSIAAFLMGFGWGGIAGFRGADWPLWASGIFATGCGAGMVWLLAILLRALMSMQSSGNVSARDAIGAEGEVYVAVPANGAGGGQVRVVINDRQRIYNAVCDGESSLPSHTRVRILRINEDNSVTITPA